MCFKTAQCRKSCPKGYDLDPREFCECAPKTIIHELFVCEPEEPELTEEQELLLIEPTEPEIEEPAEPLPYQGPSLNRNPGARNRFYMDIFSRLREKVNTP